MALTCSEQLPVCVCVCMFMCGPVCLCTHLCLPVVGPTEAPQTFAVCELMT